MLRPCLPNRELLVTFWTAAETGRGKPHGPALQAMRWIVTKLVDAGHPVWRSLGDPALFFEGVRCRASDVLERLDQPVQPCQSHNYAVVKNPRPKIGIERNDHQENVGGDGRCGRGNAKEPALGKVSS